MTHYRPITLPDAAEPIAIADQPSPMLEWIEIARMVIDDRYQRPITKGGQATIRKIAQNFAWSCFTPVQLAPIEGGRFAVIDGQHRVHAALLCGIKSVPAMVVPIAVTEQAKAFIQVNTARTSVSTFTLLSAGLASGAEWALAADKAVADAGCRLMTYAASHESKKPGNIFCVALIRDHVRNGKAAAITTALTAIRMIDTGSATSILLYSDWILKPLIGAVSDYPGLDVETLADILRKRRPAIVMDAAERLAKTEGRGRAAVAREMFGGEIRRRLESEGRG